MGLLVTVEGQELTANYEGGNKSENHFVRTLVKTSKGKDQHWMLNLQGNICVVLKVLPYDCKRNKEVIL